MTLLRNSRTSLRLHHALQQQPRHRQHAVSFSLRHNWLAGQDSFSLHALQSLYNWSAVNHICVLLLGPEDVAYAAPEGWLRTLTLIFNSFS